MVVVAIASLLACGLHPATDDGIFVVTGTHTFSPSFIPKPDNRGAYFHRISLGGRFRMCDAPALDFQLAGTFYISNLATSKDWLGSDFTYRANAGVGVEGEVDAPVSRTLRIGGRIGLDRSEQSMITLGARARLSDAAWVGVDAFWVFAPRTYSCNDQQEPGCGAAETGLMIGAGGQGLWGAGAIAAEMLIGTIWFFESLSRCGEC